jgi:hypothetical protein
MTGWGWGWDLTITLGGCALLTAMLLWAEHASVMRTRMRKLGRAELPTEHVCPLPWWRPFRKLGERIQCTQCNATWRWDRYYWVPGDSTRMWINEHEEAEQAKIAEQAKRNAH